MRGCGNLEAVGLRERAESENVVEESMLAIVRIALNKPYTFVVMAMLIVIFGVTAAVRTPPTFSQHRHSGRRRGVDLRRLAARRHVEARDLLL